MTPRWPLYLFAALALLAAGAGAGRWYGAREGRAAAIAYAERVQEVEAQLEIARTRASTTTEALAVETARADRLELELAAIERAKADGVAEVRRPMPTQERVRRVRRALALAAPDAATSTASVIPMHHGGREGAWVDAPTLALMHEALVLQPLLEAQVETLTAAMDSHRRRAALALEKADALQLQVDVTTSAWALAEGELAEERARGPPPTWLWYAGTGAAVVVTAILTYLFTREPAVTVIQ